MLDLINGKAGQLLAWSGVGEVQNNCVNGRERSPAGRREKATGRFTSFGNGGKDVQRA